MCAMQLIPAYLYFIHIIAKDHLSSQSNHLFKIFSDNTVHSTKPSDVERSCEPQKQCGHDNFATEPTEVCKFILNFIR